METFLLLSVNTLFTIGFIWFLYTVGGKGLYDIYKKREMNKSLVEKVARDTFCLSMEAKLLYFIATAPKERPHTISQIVSVSRGGLPLEFDPLFQLFIDERLQPLMDAKLIRSETWFEEVTNCPNQVFLLGDKAPKLFRSAEAHFQAGVEPPRGGAIILDFPKLD